MKRRKIYAMAIMAAFTIFNRAAKEHLGLYDDPIPMEIRYEGVLLNTEERIEKRRIKQLELIIEMDSVLGNRPGRSYQLREIQANRARKELEQMRAGQKQDTNK